MRRRSPPSLVTHHSSLKEKGSRAPRPGARELSKEEKGSGPHQPSEAVVTPTAAFTTRAARIRRGCVLVLRPHLRTRKVSSPCRGGMGPGAPGPMFGRMREPQPPTGRGRHSGGSSTCIGKPRRAGTHVTGLQLPPGVSQFLDAPTSSRKMALRDSHLGPFGTAD